MTTHLPYAYWRTITAARQWADCDRLRRFPPCIFTALLGAWARAMVGEN